MASAQYDRFLDHRCKRHGRAFPSFGSGTFHNVTVAGLACAVILRETDASHVRRPIRTSDCGGAGAAKHSHSLSPARHALNHPSAAGSTHCTPTARHCHFLIRSARTARRWTSIAWRSSGAIGSQRSMGLRIVKDAHSWRVTASSRSKIRRMRRAHALPNALWSGHQQTRYFEAAQSLPGLRPIIGPRKQERRPNATGPGTILRAASPTALH